MAHINPLTPSRATIRLAALPEVAGRGTVVVMFALWQARISGPLK